MREMKASFEVQLLQMNDSPTSSLLSKEKVQDLLSSVYSKATEVLDAMEEEEINDSVGASIEKQKKNFRLVLKSVSNDWLTNKV